MKTRLLAVALAAIVASCGSVAGSGGSDPSPTPMVSVTVTKTDNQRTVAAHVGDHIQIALGDDINWQLEPPDGTVLARDPVQNYMLVRGTQAIWLARSAGRSTIKASGGVSCPSGAACPLLLAVFTATVEVIP
ncbi:MAG: hypothetical protein M3T56_15360 [Chloroflexota bacterium]|nr:hypothetical protein [Chloroflexota bacterium]